MKIIHCSDIHLDSRLEGVNAKERNNELLSTFNKIVDYAISDDVGAIIIAGDLFDCNQVSLSTKNFLIDLISKTPDLDFLYLKGNHDGLDIFFEDVMPSNFKPFFNEWTKYVYDDVTIAGVEIDNDNYMSLYDSLKLDPNSKNIVVMHGQVLGACKPDTVNIQLLKNKNIDYLALGHYHSFSYDKLDARGFYCYSGCMEGRGYDEAGEKGFVVIDTQNLKKLPQLVTGFGYRTVYEIDVDITGLSSYIDIKNAINKAVSKIDSKHYIKIKLTGTYSLDTNKDLHHLKLDFDPLYYSFKIQDNTVLEINIEDYKYDISLKGELIRSVLKSDLPSKQKEDIINFGIRVLKGEDIML